MKPSRVAQPSDVGADPSGSAPTWSSATAQSTLHRMRFSAPAPATSSCSPGSFWHGMLLSVPTRVMLLPSRSKTFTSIEFWKNSDPMFRRFWPSE